MSSNALNELRESLYASGLVQPLDGATKGKSISVLCRQVPGQEAKWITLVDRLLEIAETGAFEAHICRRYVRRTGKLAFGWYLEVSAKSAKELVAATASFSEILRGGASIPQAQIIKGSSINRAQVMSQTEASPRAPDRSIPDPVAPKTARTGLRTTNTGLDKKGNQTYIQEMPLPHVYGDINRPKPGSSKGAASSLGNSELFNGLSKEGNQ